MESNTSNSPKVEYTGGVRDLKTAGSPIKRFSTPQEAYNNLYNDIHKKFNGGSTWVKPETTLAEYISKFAPKEDNNNPTSYTQKMAERLNTKLKEAGSNTVITKDSSLGSIKEALIKAKLDPEHVITEAHLKTEDPKVLRDLNKEPSAKLQSTSTQGATPIIPKKEPVTNKISKEEFQKKEDIWAYWEGTEFEFEQKYGEGSIAKLVPTAWTGSKGEKKHEELKKQWRDFKTQKHNSSTSVKQEVKPKVETKIEPKIEVKPKTVIKVPNKELTKNLIENNIPKTESGKPLSNNDLIKKTDEALQQVYYEATNPVNKGNKKIVEKYSTLLNTRKKLVDNINAEKSKEAGAFDNFLNNNLPENGLISSTALNKFGVTDEVIKTDYDVPKFESYLERATKNKEKELVTKKYEDLNPGSKTPYLKFRYSASNSDPIKVNAYSTRKNRNNKTEVPGKGTLLHFLDEDPLTGFQHANTKSFYKNQKPDDFVGVLEESKNGTFLKIVPKKEASTTAKKFLIRQTKFDNIDFNTTKPDSNFKGHTYWTDKKTGKATIPISIGKDANDYNKTSGQAVIFIFKYNDEIRYVNFANSPNAIRAEGERIKKEYKLKNGDLTIGLSDAGSFSAASRSNNNKITNAELMSNYYNTSGDTGAGLSFE